MGETTRRKKSTTIPKPSYSILYDHDETRATKTPFEMRQADPDRHTKHQNAKQTEPHRSITPLTYRRRRQETRTEQHSTAQLKTDRPTNLLHTETRDTKAKTNPRKAQPAVPTNPPLRASRSGGCPDNPGRGT